MKTLLAISLFAFSVNGYAVSYECATSKKVEPTKDWTSTELEKWQFSTKLTENSGKATLSRCSLSTAAKKITCDNYEVDRIEFDPMPRIKKYYVFRSQFNFQIFEDLTSVEDNGRGSIQFGKCKVVSP